MNWNERRRVPIAALVWPGLSSGLWPGLAPALALALALAATAAAHAQAAPPPVLDDFAKVLPQLQPGLRAQLQRRAGLWTAWSESQREAYSQRLEQWDSLPRAERDAHRERYRAWQALPAAERSQLRRAAAGYRSLPAERQQALRAQFDALDSSEQRGWMLGPVLGADYPALQPLLAQLPASEHAPLLQVLRAMTPVQRRDLAVLVQRTPPQGRAQLRRELVSTAAGNRDKWLWGRLDR